MVKIADRTLLPVQRFGRLKLELQQPDVLKAVTLYNITHMPTLGRNLLPTRQASERSGEPSFHTASEREVWRTFPQLPEHNIAWPRKSDICTFRLGASGFFEVMKRRHSHTENKPLSSRALLSRVVIDTHRALRQPSEHITRDAANQLGVELSGPWTSCDACSKAKARRNAGSRRMNTRYTGRVGRLFVDLGGCMPTSYLGGSKCVMDGFTRFKVV